jgi:uncharacterized tellurite resistance protein B-like protein
MLGKLVSFLKGEEGASASRQDALQLQVAALLVEAATMDSSFDVEERAAIQRVLAAYFKLSPAETDELLTAATKKTEASVQIFGFTRGMAERLEYEERVKIIEMLWEVAYADGVLTPEEDSLIRRVAGLIYVSDTDRGAARRRVLAAKGHAA